MNEMNREMRRMSEREERLAKKADRNIGRHQSGEKVSRFRRITNYLGEVRTELKRVNWPSYSTLIFIYYCHCCYNCFFTIFIFGMDFSFKNTLINLLSFGE